MKNFHFSKRPVITARIINRKSEPDNRPKNLTENMEGIVKVLPMAYAFAVGLGLLDLVNYYNKFDIQIWRYLEFADVLLYFVNHLIQIILFTLLLLVLSISITAPVVYMKERVKSKIIYFFTVLLIVISASIIFNFVVGTLILPLFFMILLVATAFIIFTIYLIDPTVLKNKNSYNYIILITLIFSFEFYRFRENKDNYNMVVKNGETLADIKLTLKDFKIFKTSDSILYFGSTRKYHFFRKKFDSQNPTYQSAIDKLTKSIKGNTKDNLNALNQIKLLRKKIDSLNSIQQLHKNFNIIIPESQVLESRIESKILLY